MTRVAFIRTKAESTIIRARENGGLDQDHFNRTILSQKSGSSSKNIILGLQRLGMIAESEEWKFWDAGYHEIAANGQMTIKLFPCNDGLTSDALLEHIQENGPPEILWVEGTDYPPFLQQIFESCPNSFKLVYSKEWRPWRIENLDQYDLCLVDEEWEADEVRKHHPDVHCGVWDKLIDYEVMHRPIPCDKIYDICYVAYLRGRKNHELLLRAMHKLSDRKLTCVCVGDDRKGNREELERLAAELKLAVHFTGEVPKPEVNLYVNQSRVGVMCAVLDAAPRAILEYMAADIPVLVNSELWAGSRYVGPAAGLVKSPDEFHLGIAELLDHREDYAPRALLLQNYSFEKVMHKFIGILQEAGKEIRSIQNVDRMIVRQNDYRKKHDDWSAE